MCPGYKTRSLLSPFATFLDYFSSVASVELQGKISVEVEGVQIQAEHISESLDDEALRRDSVYGS